MKKSIFWIIGIGILVLLLFFLANKYVRSKLETVIEEDMKITSYQDLDVNIFLNRYSVENVKIQQDRFSANAEKITAKGLSYYQYFFKNNIELDELEIQNPIVDLLPADSLKSPQKKQRDVLVQKLEFKNGRLRKNPGDSLKNVFYAKFPEAIFNEVRSGMDLAEVKSYRLQLDSVYLKMNAEHYISVGGATAHDGKIQLKNFRITPFYPPKVFDQKVPYEKDRVTLKVPTVRIDSLTIGKLKDSLYFRNPTTEIDSARLSIYRNKLLPDGTETRPLYNEMLRNLPFKLHFEKVVLNNGEIVYEEQVKAEAGPAVIRLAGINANLTNLHNVRKIQKKPRLSGNADFMRGTPVTLELEFPVFDPQNPFSISGSFGRLKGEALDPYLVPAMNLRARGIMEQASFNFNGTEDILKGRFSLDYQEFEIEVLGDKGEEKKGFLSSVANLFVDNKKEPDDEESQVIEVERDKKRSFWNFVWRGLQDGLRASVGQF